MIDWNVVKKLVQGEQMSREARAELKLSATVNEIQQKLSAGKYHVDDGGLFVYYKGMSVSEGHLIADALSSSEVDVGYRWEINAFRGDRSKFYFRPV